MNKPFNGFSVRPIAKINERDHIVSVREDLLDWSVMEESGALGSFTPVPNALVGDLDLLATGDAGGLIIDDGGHAGVVAVLDCLDPKEMRIRYLESHGGIPVDDSFSVLPTDPTGLSLIADEGALVVTVGGSVSGVIDTDGDTDDITVSLVAGQTYLVSMRGTGAGALSDPLLRVFAPGGITQVATDDDGGNGRNSLLTFTANQTGDFVIRAESFNNGSNDVGAYTVDVRVQGTDAIGFTNATSAPIGLGTTFGFREFGTGNQSPLPGVLDGDTDRYSVTLEAGHFYLFEVAGGWDGSPAAGGANSMNTFIALRNAAGLIVNNNRAQNDNIGSDLSSALGFTATETGTYYLDVHARTNHTGGYVVDITDIDFSGESPLDAINWASADEIDTVDVAGVPTAFVYFGNAGETFGEPGLITFGWNATEKAAVMTALLEFTKITGIQYLETTDVNQAEFRLNTVSTGNFGAYFYPQDPVFGSQQGIGIFNVNSGGWDKPGVSTLDVPGNQVSLERGGFSFAVILHEFGHGHGLSHAHDTGGGSDIMPGVLFTTGFYSVYNLNQGIYTVMSYNDAFQTHPDGTTALNLNNIDNGWSASLSAFDIAVLQQRYGVHDHNTGDDVYTITDVENDAAFECIWDSGGTDAIAYGGVVNAIIDLTAATLDYSPTGGGPLSFINAPGVQTYRGGYTIANGVVIENATSGGGNDQLIGNSAANVLTGNGGNDQFMGREGNDTIVGGLGTDTAFYEGVRSHYVVTSQYDANGNIVGYTVEDAFPLIADAALDEGTDSLTGVEALSFADMTMSIGNPVQLFDENDVLVGTFATIQAAVNASQNDYRVYVSPGTYAEVVTVDKDITIEGPNAGIAGTGARGAEAIINGGIYVNADGVTLDGLRLENGATVAGNPAGIFVNADDATITNMVLHGAHTSQMAAVLTTFDQVVGTTGLVLSNSLIENWAWGTYFNPTTTFTVTGNSFDGNDNAILGDDFGVGSFIDDNSFTNSVGSHVGIGSFDSVEDARDYFGTNTFGGDNNAVSMFAYGDGTPGGQELTGTDQANGFFASEFVAGSGTDATFHGLGGDDYMYGGSGNDTLDGGADTDTAAYDGDRADYTLNETRDANGMVTAFNGATETIVTGSDEGTDSFTSIEQVEFDDVTLTAGAPVQLFDASDNLIGTFDSIQDAVDAAASGNTIKLAAGTFAESVIVSEDVTIVGASTGDSNITGGLDITANGVTVDNVTITGTVSVAGSSWPAGVYVRGNDFTLSNSTLSAAPGTAVNGDGNNSAILTQTVTGLDVHDNTFTGYVIGAYVSGPGSTGSIHDNHFQGVDGVATSGMGNGVNSETALVDIEDNTFDGLYSGSLNLFPFGPGSTVDLNTYVSGNSFTNTVARPIQIFPNATTPNFIGTDHNESFRGDFGPAAPMSFEGRGGADRAFGGTQGDNLAGDSGDDGLFGADGDDTLTGGDGNDQLDGEAGNDVATYGGPRAGYTVGVTQNSAGLATAFTSVTDTDGSNGNDGSDTLASVERVQFTNVTLDIADAVQLYDNLGNLIGTFDTIQSAVDAAINGQVVRVAAGTYNETVTVDVDITIEGANRGIAGNGARGAETVIDGGVYMHGAGATLDGLTVLGGGTLAGNPAGIYVDVDDVTLTNLVVQGDGTTGTGITTPFNGGVTGLVLSNSRVDDWTNGTYFNPTTQFTATGNSFDGNGVALTGDDWDDVTLISGNSFTNSSLGHVGYGVFDTVDDVGAFFGSGNSFDASGGRIGIFAYGDGTPGGQTIDGTPFGDAIIASEFVAGSGTNSTFNGLGGNDYFYGGTGNDSLNGGIGTDTAAYDGPRGNYSIGFITGPGGRIVGFSGVSEDFVSGTDEGNDALTSVERLEFSNLTLDATQPVQLFNTFNNLIGTFDTIQAAIDAANDNYTIRVGAGTFDEDLTIDVGVRILGVRAGVPGTGGTRDPANGVNETTIIGHAHVTAGDNVTLDGLRFLNDATTTGGGPSNPTLQFQTGGGVDGHRVTNSIFWSTVQGGNRPGPDDRAISAPVLVDGLITITNNLISGSQQGLFGTASWGRAIWFDGGGVNLEVNGNTIEWSRTGLNLDLAGTSGATVQENVLRNLGTAVAVGINDDGAIIVNNDVSNVGDEFNYRNLTTDIFFDADDAIDVLTPVGNSNDVVVVLGGSGNDTLLGTAGSDLLDGNNNPAAPNAADTDTLDGRGGDDLLFGRGGNDGLTGAAGADLLSGGDGDDSLTGGTENDALLGGAGVDTAHYVDSLDPNDVTLVADADPVTPGDQPGWSVVTATEGTDTVAVDILDSAGENILLVGNGGFATIQEAVDAASDGDTILIAAGTYTEQVVIDGLDNLTLRSVGGTVTIKAPADLVETGRSSSDREIHGVLTVNDSDNVTIDDVDIDGDGRGNTVDEGGGAGQANFYGVFFRNSSGTLLDVDVTGVRDPYPGGNAAGGEPLQSGVQRGVGVVADNDSLMSFVMTGGSISDFQKNATVFNNADLSVTGVTITGGGAQTIIAQNGIQVLNSTGTIANNVITGIGYAGPADAYSGVILGFANTDLNILDNVITGSNDDSLDAKVVGIFIVDFGPPDAPNSGGEISGNTISFVDTGIGVYDRLTPDSILIENNSVTNVDTTDPFAAGVDFQPTPSLAVPHNVDGSAAADNLSGGAAADILSGLGGDDLIVGNGGGDTLSGGANADTLTGGEGDDTIDGGSGTDTATYGGGRAGYTLGVTQNSAGLVTSFNNVTDTDGSNGNDASDTLSGIERLQFTDVTLDLGQPVQLFNNLGNLIGTFDTIQAAVDAATSGQVVRVAAGSYAETVTVDVDITIEGANRGIAGNGARGAETVIDGGVYMHGAGATLDGLTVLGGGTLAGNPAGIYVDVDDVTLTNLVVQGDGTTGTGITTPFNGGVTGLVLSNSRVDDWTNGTYFNPTTQFTATGNSFDGNGVALTGDDWDDVTLIDNNDFTNNGAHVGYGVLDSVEDVGAFFGSGNSFDGTGRHVFIFGYGDGSPGGQTIHGTEERDSITASEFVPGSGLDAEYFGRGGDDRLSGGTGNDILHGDGGNDELRGGDDQDTLEGGVGDDVLRGDAGTDQAIFADTITVGGITAVADGNPNLAGDQPGWSVTTATEGTDLLTGVEIVNGAALGNILLVGNGGFASLQAAIDAAVDGDTILLAAGTFAGDVTIDVSVQIIGAQAGNAVSGRDAAGGTGETTLLGHVHVTAADGVTIDGVRFLNDATTSGGGSANPALQFVTGGGVDGHEVTNSIFWSAVTGGANGVDDRAISISPIADGEIRITDNLISGAAQGLFSTASWGRGIWFDGGGVDLTVSGNTIQWTRTGLNLDMSGSSNATVSGNAFENLGTAVSVGVSDDNVVLDDNDHTNVGTDFNFRNLTDNVTFDADEAIDVLTPGGDPNNDLVLVLGGNGNDTLNGTAGADVLDGNNNPSPIADSDTLDGEGGNDQLFGRLGTDTLLGGAGDDMLDGGDGNDSLTGGANNDLLVGGAGIDTATFAGAMTFIDTFIGWITSSVDGNDVLQGVEIAQVAAGQRTLLVGATGFSGLQTALDNAENNDHARLASGTYSGTFSYTDSGLVVFGDAATINATFTNGSGVGIRVDGGGSADSITTSGGNDTLNGGGGNDSLTAAGGNDTLSGGGGDDTLTGGLGDDLYSVDSVADVVIEAASEGTNDRVLTSVTYTLGAAAEIELLATSNAAATTPLDLTGNGFNQILIGNAGVNTLSGGDGNDTMFGNAGNDIFVGGIGNDVAVGGLGDDTFTVDSFDAVLENAGEGNDRVRVTANYNLTAASEVELLETIDAAATTAIDIVGNNLTQSITGNAGVNRLAGAGGNDTLSGLGGNDVLDGGLDVDTAMGGIGDDTYAVDNAGDLVFETGGSGADRVLLYASYALGAGQEVELMATANQAGTAAFSLTGNELANNIQGNNGNNGIQGGGGNDVLFGLGGNDTLNGGTGVDQLNGGAGADNYVFDAALVPANADLVFGFVSGTDEFLLDNAVFTALSDGALPAGAFRLGSAAVDADDRILYNAANGQLLYDADGVGGTGPVHFATVVGAPLVAATDFTVI